MDNETLKETSKAVQETAKTTSKALDKGAQLIEFFGKLFGPSINDIGAIAHQYTEYWKVKNALNIRDKFEKLLAARNIEQVNSIPLRIGIPLIDSAINEDNETLQNLWASLLASSMTEGDIASVTKTYVETLKQLDVIDAELLNILFQLHLSAATGNEKHLYDPSGRYNPIHISIAINNLERLGIIEVHDEKYKPQSESEIVINYAYSDEKNNKFEPFEIYVSFKIYGYYFMRACTSIKLKNKEGHELLPIEDRFRIHNTHKKNQPNTKIKTDD